MEKPVSTYSEWWPVCGAQPSPCTSVSVHTHSCPHIHHLKVCAEAWTCVHTLHMRCESVHTGATIILHSSRLCVQLMSKTSLWVSPPFSPSECMHTPNSYSSTPAVCYHGTWQKAPAPFVKEQFKTHWKLNRTLLRGYLFLFLPFLPHQMKPMTQNVLLTQASMSLIPSVQSIGSQLVVAIACGSVSVRKGMRGFLQFE